MGTSMDMITIMKCDAPVVLPSPVARVLFPMTKFLVKSRFRIEE